MDYIIKDWEKKMSAFESSVEKDLKEIRKCKADIQQMRNEIQREKQGNYFVRDAQRIILSAPEIILGNVDPDGVLYDGAASKIVLRGTDVDLEASGHGGRVETRAASIRQIARQRRPRARGRGAVGSRQSGPADCHSERRCHRCLFCPAIVRRQRCVHPYRQSD